MARSEIRETRHEIMSCPACGQVIEAAVFVALEAQVVGIDVAERSASVKAAGRIQRFNVQHQCHGLVEDVDAPAEVES